MSTTVEVSRGFHNLDTVCDIESTCVFPFCGQEINARYVPQELLQKGIEVPVSVARTAISGHIRHVRFWCYNVCSYIICWTMFWVLGSSMFWTGFVLALIGGRLHGFGFMLMFIFLFVIGVHIACCVTCRIVGKRSYNAKIAQLNAQLEPYHCLATVVNSRYATAFHLIIVYYDLEPCVKHLGQYLQRKQLAYVGGQAPTGQLNQVAPVDNTTHNQFEMYAKALLIAESPEYLRKFVEKKLEEVTSQQHTLQGACLCQYVQHTLQVSGMGYPRVPHYPAHARNGLLVV